MFQQVLGCNHGLSKLFPNLRISTTITESVKWNVLLHQTFGQRFPADTSPIEENPLSLSLQILQLLMDGMLLFALICRQSYSICKHVNNVYYTRCYIKFQAIPKQRFGLVILEQAI